MNQEQLIRMNLEQARQIGMLKGKLEIIKNMAENLPKGFLRDWFAKIAEVASTEEAPQ